MEVRSLRKCKLQLKLKVYGIFLLVVFGVYMQLIKRNCFINLVLRRDQHNIFYNHEDIKNLSLLN